MLDLSRDIFTVSRLNREVRAVLEGSFPLLWVEGELSNLARPRSGHIYFSLKDEAAQVRCAMFRSRCQLLAFQPENGTRVLLRARVGLYEGRGDFQLVVEHMEPAGDGALRLAFDRLKRKLDGEGLFAEARKRPIPAFPRRVGLITSPSGAAVHDLLTVLRRRFPLLPVLIYPVAVQGEGAAAEIRAAIERAGRRADCDVLILARGGGSLEDLAAFNDETVARAVAASPIPVVSGVGHEVDITIADLVADRRAATPSAAAELVAPSAEHLMQRLGLMQTRMRSAMQRRLGEQQRALTGIQRQLRLLHPEVRMQQQGQRLDDLERRLAAALRMRLERLARGLSSAEQRLNASSPQRMLQGAQAQLDALSRRLNLAAERGLAERGERLARLVQGLEARSPLATLSRGYALVTRADDGAVVTDATQVEPGARIDTRLAKGGLRCVVEARSS